jgi:hypothetical protein
MTAHSAIRYAHNGDVSIAYMESGSGRDLLVIRGMGLSDREAGAYTLENVVDDALAVLGPRSSDGVARRWLGFRLHRSCY